MLPGDLLLANARKTTTDYQQLMKSKFVYVESHSECRDNPDKL